MCREWESAALPFFAAAMTCASAIADATGSLVEWLARVLVKAWLFVRVRIRVRVRGHARVRGRAWAHTAADQRGWVR